MDEAAAATTAFDAALGRWTDGGWLKEEVVECIGDREIFTPDFSSLGDATESPFLEEVEEAAASLTAADTEEEEEKKVRAPVKDVERRKKATLMGITTWNSDEFLHSENEACGAENVTEVNGLNGAVNNSDLDKDKTSCSDSNNVVEKEQEYDHVPKPARKASARRRKPVVDENFDYSELRKKGKKKKTSLNSKKDKANFNDAKDSRQLRSKVKKDIETPASADAASADELIHTSEHQFVTDDKCDTVPNVTTTSESVNSDGLITSVQTTTNKETTIEAAKTLAEQTAAASKDPATTSKDPATTDQDPIPAAVREEEITTSAADIIQTKNDSITKSSNKSTSENSTKSSSKPSTSSSAKLDCSDCDRVFTTLAGLKSHQQISHNSDGNPRRKFLCDECGREFLTQVRFSFS